MVGVIGVAFGRDVRADRGPRIEISDEQLEGDLDAAHVNAIPDALEELQITRDFLDERRAAMVAPRKRAATKPAAELLRYAHILRESARQNDALYEYRRLVREYPKTPQAAYAHLALAEHERTSLHPLLALARYKAVVAALADDAVGLHELRLRAAPTDVPAPSPNAKLLAFALFRVGETILDREPRRPDSAREGEQAFDVFRRVISLEPDGVLATESRNRLALAFACFGSPDEAYATFDRIAPGHAMEMLEQLGHHYAYVAKPARAIEINSELARRSPRDERICMWQASSLSLMDRLHDRVRLLAETERLVELFDRARHLELATVEACERSVVQLTLGEARVRLEDVRVHPDSETAFLADRLYGLFLHTLPDHEQVPAARRERVELRRLAP